MTVTSGKPAWAGVALAALMLLAALPAAHSVPAGGGGTLEIGCRQERPDEILRIICDRVVGEVRTLAAESGYRVVDVSALPADSGAGGVLRSVWISLDATQPPGRFDIKQIDAKLVGSYGSTADRTWENELSARGVSRDLVHPVADAIVMRVAAFLASSPTE